MPQISSLKEDGGRSVSFLIKPLEETFRQGWAKLRLGANVWISPSPERDPLVCTLGKDIILQSSLCSVNWLDATLEVNAGPPMIVRNQLPQSTSELRPELCG